MEEKKAASSPAAESDSTSSKDSSKIPMKAHSVENDWQTAKRTISTRLSYLLEKQILSDVHFIAGKEGKECISAHQLILSMSSPVFFTMFNGSLQLTDDKVILPDVEPEAFRAVLKYIYTEVVDLNASIVMSTLNAAKKYELPGLEEACEDFLLTNVSSDNAFQILSQAKFFGQQRLIDLCLRTIDEDALRAFQAEGFTEIDRDLLSLVFKRDTLAIEEKDLFMAAESWASAECKRQKLFPNPLNKRTVLGGALFFIRFPIMTAEDFSNGPVKSGLLTDKEGLDLLVYLSVSTKPKTVFPIKPRFPVELKVKLFSSVGPRRNYLAYNYSSTFSDVLSFSTDREIKIRCLGLYGASCSNSTQYNVTLSIAPSNGGHKETATFTYTSVGSTSTNPFVFQAKLPKPVKILPRTVYKITTSVTGPEDCFVGLKGGATAAAVTVGGPAAAVTFNFAATGNHYSYGIIANVIFSMGAFYNPF